LPEQLKIKDSAVEDVGVFGNRQGMLTFAHGAKFVPWFEPFGMHVTAADTMLEL
jgi:hypothetical protein